MKTSARKFSPVLFAGIVICFFLPFFHVSCSGQRIFDVTGFQLVTGSSVNQSKLQLGTGISVDKPQIEQPGGERKKIESEILAQLAFLAGILGLVFALLRTGVSRMLQVLTGAGGVVLLFLLKNKVEADFTREGVNLTGLSIGFDVGFWLALVLFAAAFVVQLIPETSPPLPAAGEEKPKESEKLPISN